MRGIRHYRVQGLAPRLAIGGDGQLEDVLSRVLAGRALDPALPAPDTGDPGISVTQNGDSWTLDSASFEAPLTYHDPVATACSLIAHLFKAQTVIDDAGLCLHAASVETGDGAVLLTGTYRTGKSLVSAACAATGLRVFSDDMVPLSPDGRTAHAPGLAIRLRLPLPDTLAAGTAAFVRAHAVARSERYLYIRPDADRLAQYGATSPVCAIVLLDRGDANDLALQELAHGDALRETILRNFARDTSAGRILKVFDGLAGQVPCFRLSYRSAEDAAGLLAAGLAAASAQPAAAPARTGGTARNAPLLDPATLISRSPGVSVTERNGELFVAGRDDRTIFSLNPTAAAVWTAAAEPIRLGQLSELFASAFPDSPRGDLERDLSGLVRRLDRRGLLSTEP